MVPCVICQIFITKTGLGGVAVLEMKKSLCRVKTALWAPFSCAQDAIDKQWWHD